MSEQKDIIVREGRVTGVALAATKDEGRPALVVQCEDASGAFQAVLTTNNVIVELFKQLMPGSVRLAFVMNPDDLHSATSLVSLGDLSTIAQEEVSQEEVSQ